MDKNTRLLLAVFGVVILMTGVAFAAVPLYDVFCRVTGFGGRTGISESAPDTVLDREMTVTFNTDIHRNLDWEFSAETKKNTTKIGQSQLINFVARNNGTEPVAGTAVYNVVPLKAGKYFKKTQCFCFDYQLLPAGEKVNMPVVYYIDPSIAEDSDMDDVRTITLSYSFFQADSKALDDALEAFYNAPTEPE